MAPIKSSLARSATKLLSVFRDRDTSLRGHSGERRGKVPFVASGGNIDGQPGGNGYTYHVFTSSGSFVFSGGEDKIFELLVVAGGGGGGSRNDNGSDGGGGGGAGGVIHVPGTGLDDGTYPITIGAAGAGVPESPGGPVPSSAVGGDTIFKLSGPNAHITAKGGGGGGSGPNGGPMTSNGPGGSGGGAGSGGGSNNNHYGTAVTQPVTLLSAPLYTAYGNRGGDGDNSTPHAGSGGGGAGARGVNGRNQPGGGDGGAGQPFPGFAGPIPAFAPLPSNWKSAVAPQGYFGGGGAGGSGGPGPNPGGSGGVGGGADSRPSSNDPLSGENATSNVGGGGAGGSGFTASGGTDGSGRSGGSGIVIIRYQ